jgi:uncharacterized membrane protein
MGLHKDWFLVVCIFFLISMILSKIATKDANNV